MTDDLKEPLSAFSVDINSSKKSFCWRHFGSLVITKDGKRKKIDTDNNYCKLCLENAKSKAEEEFDLEQPFASFDVRKFGQSVSTGNLIRHLRDAHNIQEGKKPASQQSTLETFMQVDRRATLPAKGKDKRWLLARDLALWFCRSLLPFDFSEDEGTNDFMRKYKVIGKEESLPVRTTISREALAEVYDVMYQYVKGRINESPRHSAVTFDLWTDSFRRRAYITFTYHHLSFEFTLHTYTLGVWMVTGSKTGEKISEEIWTILEKFGVHEKRIIPVTDAGANVQRAVELSGFPEKHLCLGHGLHNLVTVDGVKSDPLVEALVQKCKKIVRAVRYRAADLELEAQKEIRQVILDAGAAHEVVEADSGDPVVDVDDPLTLEADEEDSAGFGPPKNTPTTVKTFTVTRWHALLMMLQSLGENRGPVNVILRMIKKEDLALTISDWNLLRDLVKFLSKFKSVVTHLSADKTPTMNLALLFRSEIRSCLEDEDNDPLPIASMKTRMLAKLDHRFPITDLVVTAALLDPRFQNLDDIDRFLDEEGTTKVEFLAGQVLKRVRESDLNPQTSDSDGTPEPRETGGGRDDLVALALKHSRIHQTDDTRRTITAECQAFLTSSSISSVPDGDLLKFWRERRQQFPWLSALARAVLCVPATSTPSERVFSVDGLLVTPKRSRLAPQTINRVTFIHDNYEVCKNVLD